MPPLLFISYKRGTTVVAPIMEKLRDAGYSLWFDRDEIRLGDSDWQARIDEGLERSNAVILNITPTACTSQSVKYEVKKALELSKPIFPIIVERIDNYDDAIHDLGLPHRQHIEDFTDVSKWNEYIQRLLRDLERQGLRITSQNPREQSDKVSLSQPHLPKLDDQFETNDLASSEKFHLKFEMRFDLSEVAKNAQFKSLKYTPDGEHLVGGLNRDRIAVWQTKDWKLIATGIPPISSRYGEGTDWPTRAVAISPDGHLVASTTYENAIQLWQLTDLNPFRVIDALDARPTSVAFSPDGEWLIAGLENDGQIHAWSIVDDFRHVDYVTAASKSVGALMFHPNKLAFFSASEDGTVKFWRIIREKLEQIRIFEGHEPAHIVDIAVSSDGSLVAVGSTTGQISLWQVDTGNYLREFRHLSVVRSLLFSKDGSLLFSSSNDKTLKVWDVSNGHDVYSKTFTPPVCTIDLSPDGQLLVSGVTSPAKAEMWKIMS